MGQACYSDNTSKKQVNLSAPTVNVTNKSKKTIKALEQWFPGALRGTYCEEASFKALDKMGFTSENTLVADCSCPDEVNHSDPSQDITQLFKQRWGYVYPISNLAGLPFSGKTGWDDFSSQAPKNGNIIVIFAPHVGIDKNGVVGKVNNEGKSTYACGSVIGAFNAIVNDKSEANF